MPFELLAFSIAGFFLGSIPFGRLIAGIVARIDITKRGSGNIGATNVARELGLKWGIVTLLLDMIKGFLPVVLFAHFSAHQNLPVESAGLSIVGLSALLGHQFSVFQKFRGGKGVATALGVFAAISPGACILALFVFVIIVYKWDFVSLGSMVSALAMPIFLWILGKPPSLILASLVMAGLVCLKHKENIHRLVKGQENRWRRKDVQVSSSSNLSNSSSE